MERREAIQKHIRELLDREVVEYQDLEAKKERHELSKIGAGDEFPVWAELELFAGDIRGYASTIAWKGFVDNPETALEKVRSRSLFNIAIFVDWYFSDGLNYPKIKADANTLEYIRLVTLEHLMLQVENLKG